MISRTRRWFYAVSLASVLLCIFGFLTVSDGFMGRFSRTGWVSWVEKDSFLCKSLNGEGSDDQFGFFLLSLLVISLLLCILRWSHPVSVAETLLFFALSIPSILFLFNIARCADVLQTIFVGRNIWAFATVLSWFCAAASLLMPKRNI